MHGAKKTMVKGGTNSNNSPTLQPSMIFLPFHPCNQLIMKIRRNLIVGRPHQEGGQIVQVMLLIGIVMKSQSLLTKKEDFLPT
jgi:hypothetical protein